MNNQDCSPIRPNGQEFLFDTSSIQSLQFEDLEEEERKDIAEIANSDLRPKARKLNSEKAGRTPSDYCGTDTSKNMAMPLGLNTSVGASIAKWMHREKLGLSKNTIIVMSILDDPNKTGYITDLSVS